MKQKVYVMIIYLGALLLSLSGCSDYYKSTVEVGQCYMTSGARDGITVEITEKREFGVSVKVYERGKLIVDNAYMLYPEFERQTQRDCHKEVK